MAGLSQAQITRQQGPYTVIDWLTNPEFISVATSSTHDLCDDVKKMAGPLRDVDDDDIFCMYLLVLSLSY